MALPEGGSIAWPPEEWQAIYDKYAEWSAWYSGDAQQIADVYARLVGRGPHGRFWAREVREERRVMLHVPVAGDIAEVAADLLFSEVPDIRIAEAHDESAPRDAIEAQDRLWQLIDDGGVHSRLLEAAETASALGGVFIGPVWDTTVADMPLLRVVQADAALPEFRWGQLVAVTLWRVVEDDGSTVWRHLERHEPGVILHGLYRGTTTELGRRVPLASHPATADLQEVVTLPPQMQDTLAIRYVPNMRPSRVWRSDPIGTYLGRSDYSGSESLMDALDEVYTSWQRDIRLAKARLTVPDTWLQPVAMGDDGKAVLRFDEDKELFVALPMDATEGTLSATLFQPAIRFTEHEQTCLHYLERIISAAGYSPQSFGLHIEGRAESGTALRIRERKSFVTTAKKRRYWEPALADVLWMMLVLDREIFRSGVTPYRPAVALADSIAESTQEVAQSIELLSRAKAASTRTLVEMLHPDWSDEEIDAEVQRIMEEQGQYVPDPLQVGID